MQQPQTKIISFVAGLIVGVAAYHAALAVGGHKPVSEGYLLELEARLLRLEQENAELTDELFAPRVEGGIVLSGSDMPYDETADAASSIIEAREQARAENKFLMVTFGANWCLDCRTLHHHLTTEPVAGYAQDLFRFVNIDVGKLNQNRDVAEGLGVSLARGIPVAIIFDRDGSLLGTTNDGQLEPARYYSSKQILKFVRDIAERRRIVAPDAID
ncbi:MAG TPA: thioredoxin family protein [Woeseiaceae bacterium]|jgi:protein disulfide-isomerase|nr:thioredoxin family protein [Woeseiaceae bacterium]